MRRERRDNWKFSYKVLVPVIVAVLLMVAISAGFILWSTMKSDDRALDRQTRLVSHMLDKARDTIVTQQQDATGWDDAVEALRGPIDHEWIDGNLGYSIFSSYAHNRIYVLDPQLKPVYAMREGGDVPAETFEDDRASIAPIAERLTTIDGQSAIASYNNGFGDVPNATDIGVVGGKPALVSIVPIVSASDEHNVEPGNAFFHVAVRFLDDALAAELTEQFMLEGAHFSSDPRAKPCCRCRTIPASPSPNSSGCRKSPAPSC